MFPCLLSSETIFLFFLRVFSQVKLYLYRLEWTKFFLEIFKNIQVLFITVNKICISLREVKNEGSDDFQQSDRRHKEILWKIHSTIAGVFLEGLDHQLCVHLLGCPSLYIIRKAAFKLDSLESVCTILPQLSSWLIQTTPSEIRLISQRL